VARGLLVALVVLLGATPALAQTTPTGTPPASTGATMTLTAQDPWTPVGGETRFGLDIATPPEDASVSVTVGQSITSRRQFDTSVQGGPITSVLGQTSIPLADVPEDGSGRRLLTVGLQDPTRARDPLRLNLTRSGVYPLDVELRDADDQTVAMFRTMLVVAAAGGATTVAEPLSVAWVWPMSAPPSFLPSGEPDRDVLASLRATGRLGEMAIALDSVDDVPVTLAPTAETVEAWSEHGRTDPTIESTFDALRRATSGRRVLDGSYVPVDLAALLERGMTEAVDDTLTRGAQVLTPTLGVATDSRTRVVRPASAAAVTRLQADGVDRVVVPTDALVGPETRFTLAQPVTLTLPGTTGSVTALPADPGLQAILAAGVPAAQRVQLLLAGLAVIALEQPSVPRVATIVNPDGFDPPVELYEDLLRALRDNPFVRPVTVAEAFDTIGVEPAAPTVTGTPTTERELAAPATAPPAVNAAEYRNQRARLNSFGALTRPGDPAVADADRSLLASVATGWPADIGLVRARAHLGVVDRVIGDLVSQIEVPDPRTITLTSRSGEIPLTFRNETGFPIRLRAALASEKLFFPEGTVLELELPPKSTTVRVAVEARTSGTFPLDLEVTSTDGVLAISQRRLEVRSTFVSTVGVVLMASAVAFLAIWWGLDLRRRRRRRRQPTTA